MVLEHVLGVEFFKAKNAKPIDPLPGKFMGKVSSLSGDLLVHVGDGFTRLFSFGTTFVAFGKFALGLRNPFLTLA